jgi:hypothetical protein
MSGWRCAALTVGFLACWPAVVRGQATPPPLEMALDACVDAVPADVVKLVGIELAAVARDGLHAAALGAARIPVTVSCRGDRVVVRVEDPITDKTLERGVRLGRAAPAARSRLLALAIVELLVASWTELAAKPREPSAAATADAGARKVAEEIARARLPASVALEAPRRRLVLGAFGGGGHFMGAVAPAAGLRLALEHGARLTFAIDARLSRAGTPMPSGQATFESIDASPAVLVRASAGAFALKAGLGLRLGYGRLAGEPARPDRHTAASFTAPWAGGLVSLRLARGFGPLVIELEAEGGAVLLPVKGLVDDARETAVEGAWIGGTFGVGWAL